MTRGCTAHAITSLPGQMRLQKQCPSHIAMALGCTCAGAWASADAGLGLQCAALVGLMAAGGAIPSPFPDRSEHLAEALPPAGGIAPFCEQCAASCCS